MLPESWFSMSSNDFQLQLHVGNFVTKNNYDGKREISSSHLCESRSVRIVSKAYLAIDNMILSFLIFIHILHLLGYQQNFFSLEIIFTWIFFIFSLPLTDMYLFSDKNVAVQYL